MSRSVRTSSKTIQLRPFRTIGNEKAQGKRVDPGAPSTSEAIKETMRWTVLGSIWHNYNNMEWNWNVLTYISYTLPISLAPTLNVFQWTSANFEEVMNGSRSGTESLPEVRAEIDSREIVVTSYRDTLDLAQNTERENLRKVCRGRDQTAPISNTLPRALVREPIRKFVIGGNYIIPAN